MQICLDESLETAFSLGGQGVEKERWTLVFMWGSCHWPQFEWKPSLTYLPLHFTKFIFINSCLRNLFHRLAVSINCCIESEIYTFRFLFLEIQKWNQKKFLISHSYKEKFLWFVVRQWCSGIIVPSQGIDPGSTPGWRRLWRPILPNCKTRCKINKK